MNVFLVGWSPSGGADVALAVEALAGAELLRDKLGGAEPRSWASPDGHTVVAYLSHGVAEVPFARYVDVTRDKMTLFAGMPFVWTDEHRTDGVSTLDAAFFATRDLSGDDLDGRFAVARYDSGSGALEILTDRLGAYPVFSAGGAGMTWFGNAPYAVARAAGQTRLDAEALGHFMTIGWSLGGRPIWSGVERLPRATLEVRTRQGDTTRSDLLPAHSLAAMFGQRPDMPEAARVLTATVAGQGSWPGRANVVPISGGRDSRVILAAAVAAGLDFSSRTIAFPRAAGYPNTPDVVIGGEVMASLGRRRGVVTPAVEGGLRWSAHLVRQATHGLMSLLETGLIAPHEPGAPLEVIHSGGGGELSRGLLFIGDNPSERELARRIFGNWVYKIPQPIVSAETLGTTGEFVTDWVTRHRELGFARSDLPDAFWLLERLQCWLAPPQHLQELSNDTTAPLWSPRMLPFTFAGTSRSRTAEPLHYGILSELAPDLARIRFEGLNPSWPTFPSAARRGRRQRDLAFKVRRELRRRLQARRAEQRTSLDPLLRLARDDVREAASSLGGHVIWDVLDRRRTAKLLSRELYTLDPRSQSTIWRLATVLCADMPLD